MTKQQQVLNYLHRMGYSHAQLMDHGTTVGLAVEVPEGRFAARPVRGFDWDRAKPMSVVEDLIENVNNQIEEARRRG